MIAKRWLHGDGRGWYGRTLRLRPCAPAYFLAVSAAPRAARSASMTTLVTCTASSAASSDPAAKGRGFESMTREAGEECNRARPLVAGFYRAIDWRGAVPEAR